MTMFDYGLITERFHQAPALSCSRTKPPPLEYISVVRPGKGSAISRI